MSVTFDDIQSLTYAGDARRWNLDAPIGTPVVLTYSFGSQQASYDPGPRPGFSAMTEWHQRSVRLALDKWSESSGLTFVEVPDAVIGDMRFGMFDMSRLVNFNTGGVVSGLGYSTVPSDIGGDVFINSVLFGNPETVAPGRSGFGLLLHEIGHGLGFQHAYQGHYVIDPNKNDSYFTVMASRFRPDQTSLGIVDVEAARYYYGREDYLVAWNPDTLTVTQTGTADAQWILGTNVADVAHGLDGADTQYGYDGFDSLYGDNGDDVLYGNLEVDLLEGGGGNDLLYGGQNNGPASADTGDPGGPARQREGVETLLGGDGDDRIYGNYGSDHLDGGNGNDLLYGGQDSDTLSGGAGDDTLFGNRGDDVLVGGAGQDVFALGPGADTVGDFSLADGDRIDVSDPNTVIVTTSAGGSALLTEGDSSLELIGVVPASVTAAVLF